MDALSEAIVRLIRRHDESDRRFARIEMALGIGVPPRQPEVIPLEREPEPPSAPAERALESQQPPVAQVPSEALDGAPPPQPSVPQPAPDSGRPRELARQRLDLALVLV